VFKRISTDPGRNGQFHSPARYQLGTSCTGPGDSGSWTRVPDDSGRAEVCDARRNRSVTLIETGPTARERDLRFVTALDASDELGGLIDLVFVPYHYCVVNIEAVIPDLGDATMQSIVSSGVRMLKHPYAVDL